MKKLYLLLFLFHFELYALSLEEALVELEKNNIELKLAQTRDDISKSEKVKKKASSFGQISTFASYTKYNEPRTLAPLTPPINPGVTTSDSLTTVGISYNVFLFNGFKDLSEIKITNIQESLQKEITSLTFSQLAYNTQSLYLDILSLSHSLKATQEHLDTLEKLELTTNLKYQYGKKSFLDTLKIASDIKNTQAQMIQTQTKIAILKDNLSFLIYGDIQEIDTLEETIISSKEKVIAYDIEKTSTLKIAQNNIQKSNQQYINTKSEYYPKISLNSSYANTYAKSDEETVSSIGVHLNWTLFEFGV
jgi:outer membrane protein TolC